MIHAVYAMGNNGMTVGEKVSKSLTTLALGMLVVFSVLIIIMVVIMIVGKVFKSIDQKKEKKVTPAEPAAPVVQTVAEKTQDEGEIVAAITAALALALEEEPGSFRVVSFKKTTAKSAWNKK